jgi:RNA polymerase sigma-70 factor (ECF subfamily)
VNSEPAIRLAEPMPRDLVLRAQRGDVEAFSAMIRLCSDRLYAIARLILRDEDRAFDAVQDTLLRAWLDIRGLRDPDRFDAWVYRLLVRACYRAAGEQRRRDVTEILLGPNGPTTADAQRQTMLRDQLARGFERLSREQRAAVVLHHYAGLSLVEAAGILQIPLGTMQSRLSRALQTMRAAIEADDRLPVFAGEAAR